MNEYETVETNEVETQDQMENVEQAAADAATEALENGATEEQIEQAAADAATEAIETTELKNQKSKAKKTPNKKAKVKTVPPTAKTAPKTATKTKPAAKTSTKPAVKPASKAKPAPKAKNVPSTNGKAEKAPKSEIGKPHMRILEAILKANRALTRAEISERTGINSGFTSILGHLDEDKREEGSLSAKGLIRAEFHDVEGKNTVFWNLTAAGKKLASK